MKKINNRYRNNNNSSNNTIYSLNYKFDSNSIAGKISGTALDLIKRYNDLAKDAHSNNDYVTAEIFRQYAEHYRKIVTEINERKIAREQQEANDNANAAENTNTDSQTAAVAENAHQPEIVSIEKTVEKEAVSEEAVSEAKTEEKENKKPRSVKKSFHVIEINKAKTAEAENASEAAQSVKPRRIYRRKTAAEA